MKKKKMKKEPLFPSRRRSLAAPLSLPSFPSPRRNYGRLRRLRRNRLSWAIAALAPQSPYGRLRQFLIAAILKIQFLIAAISDCGNFWLRQFLIAAILKIQFLNEKNPISDCGNFKNPVSEWKKSSAVSRAARISRIVGAFWIFLEGGSNRVTRAVC